MRTIHVFFLMVSILALAPIVAASSTHSDERETQRRPEVIHGFVVN